MVDPCQVADREGHLAYRLVGHMILQVLASVGHLDDSVVACCLGLALQHPEQDLKPCQDTIVKPPERDFYLYQ